MKTNQPKEDEPNPAQKYLNQLIVAIEVLWTILILRPASVSKEQRFGGPQFIKSTITEVQFVPGSQELRAPLCSTNWLRIISAAALAAEDKACIC